MARRGTIVSFINYKGGVGKTTLAVETAATLADRHGLAVLLVDLDPQTNATFYLMEHEEWKRWAETHGTLKNLFDDALAESHSFDLSRAIMRFSQDGRENLHLIPSHLELLLVDMKLAAKFGPEGIAGVVILKKALAQLREQYDVILMDCPPNLNLVTQNALVASGSYVIVAMPDFLSTVGIGVIQKAVHDLERRINGPLEALGAERVFDSPRLAGIIFNRVRTAAGGLLFERGIRKKVEEEYGDLVFESFVPESVRIAERPDMHTPLALSEYRRDLQWVNALRSVAEEFKRRIL